MTNDFGLLSIMDIPIITSAVEYGQICILVKESKTIKTEMIAGHLVQEKCGLKMNAET